MPGSVASGTPCSWKYVHEKGKLEYYIHILDRDGFNFIIHKGNSNNESTAITKEISITTSFSICTTHRFRYSAVNIMGDMSAYEKHLDMETCNFRGIR